MEETISLKEIFKVLRKRMLLIIALIIIAANISAVVSYFIITPTYQASSQFIVSQTEQTGELYDVNQIRSNVEIINTYNVIIKSPAILDEVAENLNLNLSAEQLSDKITVSTAENSQVVNVTAFDINQGVAANIANTTVEVFQERVPDLMNVDNVNVLSVATEKANPQSINPKPLLNIAIAIVLGGIIGIGIAFLLEYMDNTVKTEDDIEKRLNMSVIGVVSHIKDEDMTVTKGGQSTMSRSRGGNYVGAKKKTI